MAEDLFGDESYRILIDGRWTLEDLYVFPRAYEQVYFAVYSLMPHDDETRLDRIAYAYSVFPWQGGYSAVNFYNQLKQSMPRRERPVIKSIQYASPGWIELALLASVAGSAAIIIKSVCNSIDAINQTYGNIHKGMADRKLLRIETEKAELDLARKYAKFIREASLDMAEILHIEDLDSVNERTGSQLKTLKIQLSLYRRIRTLAEYQKKKKAKF